MADRREKVTLELTDQGYSTGMVKAAAATGLLERALKSLDGTTVNIHERISESATSVDGLNRSARNADGSINQLTGRLRVLGEVAAILAPTLAPIGGVAIAGIGGLANQFGIAAVAGGVLIGAMQGLGDALGAMNKAQLEPTEKNLQKAEDALKRLSPAARDFAKEAFALKPALVALRDMGAEALFPGLTESLENLQDLGPRVAAIMQTFGGALGDIAADSSASLASARWADFFEFIQVEGPRTLADLATTVGDLTHGLSELWEAFAPLNSDFSSWLMNVADGFDNWATGLSATDGFQEFLDYVRETGPQVADTLGAMFNAVVQLVQASAPLGGPVLAGIEAFSNAVATIADSDLGAPIMAGVTALALLNRSLAVTASLSKVSMSSGIFAGLGTASGGIKKGAGSIRSDIAAMSDTLVAFGANADKAAEASERMKGRLAKGAGLAGLAVAATGAADGLGLTNTASLALMGSLAGPPGVAIGLAAGALLDLRSAGMGATEAIRGLDGAVRAGNMDVLRQQIEAAKSELADIENLDFNAGDIFDRAKFGAADAFGGPSMDDAREKIKASEEALKDLVEAEKLAELQSKASALAYLSQTGANVDLAKWSRRSAEDIKAQADALMESQEAAEQTASSFVTLGESLDDGKKSLGDWIREMSNSADALINFTANSRTAAKRGLEEGLIASLQAAGETGAQRMRQLANATDEELERANRAWRKGQQAMQDYVNFKVPQKKVGVDINPAMTNINALEARLRAIKDEDVNIVVRQLGATTLGPRNESADGGTVPKTGRPYADRHRYLLADGEEVISNRHGQADRHRSLLKDINAGRLADGGTTHKGGKRKATGGVFVMDNTASLEESIRRLTETQEHQTEAVDRDIATRDEWAAKMADVAKGTIAGFSTGLFAKDSNPWAAGAGGGAISNLTRDIAGLGERSALQSQLSGMGLSGDALAALLSEGTNANISSLISSGQVGQYADLYAQRAALQGSTGSAAGQMAYGSQYAAADQAARASLGELQRVNTNLAGLTGRLTAMEAALAAAAETAGNSFGETVRGEVVKGHREKVSHR